MKKDIRFVGLDVHAQTTVIGADIISDETLVSRGGAPVR